MLKSIDSPLKILHLEDNALDADLVSEVLKNEQINCVIDRVVTKSDFEGALKQKPYDIILSDFSMPGFDGLAALSLAKSLAPDVPFLFLSGTIGEERAVESLKEGAADYVLKDRLQRLSAAILRARNDALHRQQQRKNEEQIRRQAELLNEAKDAIFIRNLNHEITYWNKSAERIYGWTAQEIIGKLASEILYRPGATKHREIWKIVLEKGEWNGELTQLTKAGKDIVVFSHRTLLEMFRAIQLEFSISTPTSLRKRNSKIRSSAVSAWTASAPWLVELPTTSTTCSRRSSWRPSSSGPNYRTRTIYAWLTQPPPVPSAGLIL